MAPSPVTAQALGSLLAALFLILSDRGFDVLHLPDLTCLPRLLNNMTLL